MMHPSADLCEPGCALRHRVHLRDRARRDPHRGAKSLDRRAGGRGAARLGLGDLVLRARRGNGARHGHLRADRGLAGLLRRPAGAAGAAPSRERGPGHDDPPRARGLPGRGGGGAQLTATIGGRCRAGGHTDPEEGRGGGAWPASCRAPCPGRTRTTRLSWAARRSRGARSSSPLSPTTWAASRTRPAPVRCGSRAWRPGRTWGTPWTCRAMSSWSCCPPRRSRWTRSSRATRIPRPGPR